MIGRWAGYEQNKKNSKNEAKGKQYATKITKAASWMHDANHYTTNYKHK